ncbi:MAG: hypothetical protein QOJ25_3111 [Solirubrobacteraceae bacterium]|nr:hypothetical protein [Solirubrobacteraceae bacterium]
MTSMIARRPTRLDHLVDVGVAPAHGLSRTVVHRDSLVKGDPLPHAMHFIVTYPTSTDLMID